MDFRAPLPPPKKEVKLKFWVFKLVGSTLDVCVEGYKADRSEDNEALLKCWHSTQIVARHSSRRLITNSGTVYVLQGSIDRDAANLLGYPEELIDLFQDGFPPNWQQLIESVYGSRDKEHTAAYNVSQWYENCSVLQPPSRKSVSRRSRRSSMLPLAEAVERMAEAKQLVPSRKSIKHFAPMTPVAERRVDDFDEDEEFEEEIVASNRQSLRQQQPSVRIVEISEESPDLKSPKSNCRSKTERNTEANDGASTPPINRRLSELRNTPGQSVRRSPRLEKTNTDDSPQSRRTSSSSKGAARRNSADLSKANESIQQSTPNVASELKTESVRRSPRLAPLNANDSVRSLPSVKKVPNSRTPRRASSDAALNARNAKNEKLVGEQIISENTEGLSKTPRRSPRSQTVEPQIIPTPKNRSRLSEVKSTASTSVRRSPRLTPGANVGGDKVEKPKSALKVTDQPPSPKLSSPPPANKSSDSINTPARRKRKSPRDAVFSSPEEGEIIDTSIESEESLVLENNNPSHPFNDENSRERREIIENGAKASKKNSPETNTAGDHSTSSSSQDSSTFRVPVVPKKKKVRRSSSISSEDRQSFMSEAASSVYNRLEEAGLESDYGVSRSGRIIKPPLASWTGQRIQYDTDGNVIGVADASTHVALSHLETKRSVAPLSQVLDVAVTSTTRQSERPCNESSALAKKKRRRSKFPAKLVIYSDTSDSDSVYSDQMSPAVYKRKKKVSRPKPAARPKVKEIKTKPKRPVSDSSGESSDGSSEASEKVQIKKKSPVKKKQKQKAKTAKSPAKKQLSPKVKVKMPPAKKRWTNEEVNRLRIALKAAKPRTAEDWDLVARSLGDGRTGAQCEQKANQTLGYDLQLEEEDAQRMMRENIPLPQVTARQGTLAHRLQTSRFMDKYVRSTMDEDDDLFDQGVVASNATMPSLACVTANDSLLSAMMTPVQGAGAERRYVPAIIEADETPLGKDMETPRLLDSAARDQRQRYVHQLQQDPAVQDVLGARKRYRKSPAVRVPPRRGVRAAQQTSVREFLRELENTRANDYEDDEEEERDDYFSDSD